MTSIGSVSVDVVPDATGFPEKLKAKLAGTSVKVGIDLDTARAKGQLDKLAMTRRSAKIVADVDTKGATAKLDKLARNRTVSIKAKTDRASFAQAEASASSLTRELFSLKGAAFTLGPAVIPATAALAGLTGALAAPALAGGIGAGIFGGVTIAALAKAKKDAKEIADLRKKATSATDLKQAREYSKQADAALAKLPKAEQAFIRSEGTISAGLDRLLAKSGKNVYAPLVTGSDLVAKVLPRTAPIVNAFGREADRLLGSLDKYSDSKGFESFVDFLATKGVRAFDQGATIAGHLALGVGSLVKALTPLGGKVLGNLEDASRSFDHVGQSEGFQSFLGYVDEVGPRAAHTLGDVASAGAHVVDALAPQGGVVLGLVDDLAKLVKTAKPGTLAAIAGGIGAIGLATGKLGPVKALVLISTAVSYADKHSDSFHKLALGAEEFVGAFNKLPSAVKVGLGVGAAVGAIKLRSGDVGKPGGLVNKVLGGGVQKVFVVNPGFGKGGVGVLPGKVGKEVGTAVGLSPTQGAFVVAMLTAAGHEIGKAIQGYQDKNSDSRVKPSGLENTLADLGRTGVLSGSLAAAYKKPSFLKSVLTGPGVSTGDPFKDQAIRASQQDSRTSKFGRAVHGIFGAGGDPDSVAVKNFQKLDAALLSLQKRTPGAGLKAYDALFDRSGLSAAQFSKALPKASRALDQLNRRSALVRSEKLASDFTHGASKAVILSGALRKAGISTQEYGRKLHTLPAYVQTKVTTPGAVTSRAQVQALGKQFGLTPRQVKTLMQLAGINAVVTDAAKARAAYARIPRYVHTQISVSTSRSSRAAVASNSSLNKPRTEARASGGPIFPDRSYLVGETGPEIVTPSRQAFVNTAPASRERLKRGSVTVSMPDGMTLRVDDRDIQAWFEDSYDGQAAFG